MTHPEQLSQFLAEVERRAFRQAMFAVQNEDAALDLVQDAMLKLAENYADRPADEWPMLFQRILQNTIRDHYRRNKVRSLWVSLLSSLSPSKDAEEEIDPLDTMQVEPISDALLPPDEQVARQSLRRAIDECIAKLPLRQRQAFLLRYMEELDVAQTAAAMGCSEGSVKTHCSRACHTLANWLREKGVGP